MNVIMKNIHLIINLNQENEINCVNVLAYMLTLDISPQEDFLKLI